MAIDWKELDFFGEYKSIPEIRFDIISTSALFTNFTPYDTSYHSYAKLNRKLNVSKFPDYKFCTKKDFVCTSKFTINVGENEQRPNVNIYISDYDAKTGEITLEAQCIFNSNPGTNKEIFILFSELKIYSFYDVPIKSI